METKYGNRVIAALVVYLGLVFSVESAALTCRDKPPYSSCRSTAAFNSSFFAKDFYFGTATSAYQIEGAAGRGLNTWDTFTHRYPEKTTDRSNADIGSNSLFAFKDDVATMKHMGLNAYRFSIAWSRVLPRGKLSGGVNEKGIRYYNELIDELVKAGIEPFITLFHWDLPQSLDDEYGGFLSPHILDDFLDYAELLFQRFGDRVKNWITINQPYSVPLRGYASGQDAPGRCSDRSYCDEGDSSTEPYWVAHYEILAHAKITELYRRKFQYQGGKVGITLITRWLLPYNENSEADKKAVQRGLDFIVGWFMDPLTTGDYPESMKELVGSRLPKFTKAESKILKGSMDFVGINYYFTQYAKDLPAPDPLSPHANTDMRVGLSFYRNGTAIGPAASNFMYYPKGFQEILTYIKNKYNNPLIYITENGFSDNGTAAVDPTVNDYARIDYHCSHLCFLQNAIENGSNVKGYFGWSLMDNFEFGLGYTVRFGMNYINFANLTDRSPKLSARWFQNFVTSKISLETRYAAKDKSTPRKLAI